MVLHVGNATLLTIRSLGLRVDEATPSRDLGLRAWKRLDYLIHRSIGLVLGIMVLVWFGSGVVMVYYRWPALTESQQSTVLQPFTLDQRLIGFAAAQGAAERAAAPPGSEFSWGRLLIWNGRATYELHSTAGPGAPLSTLVDAQTGVVVSPISPDAALLVARQFARTTAPVTEVTRLEHGDLYMMNGDYAADFPAYRVRFNDPARTAIYVNAASGMPVGQVTTATRFTTWFGTVPHWLYIPPLYRSRLIWGLLNTVLPAIAALLALTGIILGISQLRPRRARGDGPLSPYRGVSRWHHFAGVVCGLLVLTWSVSGVLQMFGSSTTPPPDMPERVRGRPVAWTRVRIADWQAVHLLEQFTANSARPLRVDLVQLAGRLGYDIRLDDGREFWVDAVDGQARGELSLAEARAVGSRVLAVPVDTADRLASYDRYYYARPGRELHLPVWRIAFRDAPHSVAYLNAVTGELTGFVDPAVRRWRWLRDGLHSFDYPAFNNKRPLWDLVVLPLLGGGLLSAFTGVILATRRAKRLARGLSK